MPILRPSRICATGKTAREYAGGSGDITCGIHYSDHPPCRELSADVTPPLNWVHLAQRMPTRIHINEVPEGFLVVAGGDFYGGGEAERWVKSAIWTCHAQARTLAVIDPNRLVGGRSAASSERPCKRRRCCRKPAW